jgi:hypothetical protein
MIGSLVTAVIGVAWSAALTAFATIAALFS